MYTRKRRKAEEDMISTKKVMGIGINWQMTSHPQTNRPRSHLHSPHSVRAIISTQKSVENSSVGWWQKKKNGWNFKILSYIVQKEKNQLASSCCLISAIAQRAVSFQSQTIFNNPYSISKEICNDRWKAEIFSIVTAKSLECLLNTYVSIVRISYYSNKKKNLVLKFVLPLWSKPHWHKENINK